MAALENVDVRVGSHIKGADILQAAFGGTEAEWSSIVNQTHPAVSAFVQQQKRVAVAPAVVKAPTGPAVTRPLLVPAAKTTAAPVALGQAASRTSQWTVPPRQGMGHTAPSNGTLAATMELANRLADLKCGIPPPLSLSRSPRASCAPFQAHSWFAIVGLWPLGRARGEGAFPAIGQSTP